MTELRFENIAVKASGAALVKDATTRLASGELVALVGPNGAGKTTLLKCALGFIRPTSGAARIDGDSVETLSPIDRARRIAYLPQARPLAWPARVRDVVALGRFAYGARLSRLQGADADAVARVIEECDLTAFADRRTDTLSGGELARVHAARALAGEAPLLLADEPIASLDPNHQFAIMALIKRHVDNGGGAMVVIHDIALAARFATRLVWMKDGAVLADGAPRKTLTKERMEEVFAVDVRIDMNGPAPSVTIAGPARATPRSKNWSG